MAKVTIDINIKAKWWAKPVIYFFAVMGLKSVPKWAFDFKVSTNG